MANEQQVERFDCGNGGAQFCDGCYTMEKNELGDYVRWEDFERLQDALKDIALGANMMMQPPCTPSMQRYAAEVKRVADLALGRNKTALKEVQP
jgi:hypothetical protein